MSTDTTSAIAGSFGRQDGATVRPVTTPTASVVASPETAAAVKNAAAPAPSEPASSTRQGQELAVREQELPPKEEAPEEQERLQQAVTDMTNFVQNLQRDLQFEVDTDLGQTVISVVDSETKELIRQIPSEEVLERVRRLDLTDGTGAGADGLLLKVQA